MSAKQNPTPERAQDAAGWILGVVIVMLMALDLVVWASLNNVPNPISKALVDHSQNSPPMRTASH